MSFLFALFIIIIFIVLILISSVMNIFREILGIGRKNANAGKHKKDTQVHQTKSKKKKVFEKSEGEYVDFEDID